MKSFLYIIKIISKVCMLQVHSVECCSVLGAQKIANIVNFASVSQTNGGALIPEIYSVNK